MEEKEITKDEWNAFITAQEHSPFLQSFEWSEFQNTLGFKSIFYCIRDTEKKIQAAARIVVLPMSGGSTYWYCPQGFVGNDSDSLAKLQLVSEKEAQKNNVVFVRYDHYFGAKYPLFNKSIQTHDAYPRCTRILDCSIGKDELFKNFHEKTRYNIRLALKRGITNEQFSENDGESIKKEIYSVLEQTGSRHSIRAYPRHHFDALWHVPCVKWYGALKGEKIIAVQAVVFFGDTATYLHGGSLYEHRSDMAAYALQWNVIQDACAMKYKYYDLWGIALPQDIRHPLKNVSRFKEGFGGAVFCGKGTFDVIGRPWLYKTYQVLRVLRRSIGRAL